jgi:hypothetical protein
MSWLRAWRERVAAIAAVVMLVVGGAQAYQTWAAGALGADSVLQADSTYYLTGLVTLSTYNLTTNATAAKRVTIKTDGDGGFRLDNTGFLNLSYVDFTSPNDNTKGGAAGTIAGSTGTPAAADQTVGYVIRTGTATTAITLTNWTASYCTPTTTSILGWANANSLASTLTLTNGKMRYCSMATTGVFLGRANHSDAVCLNGAVIISGLDIDATCTGSAAAGYAVINLNGAGSQTVENASFLYTGTASRSIWIESSIDATCIISNCLFVCSASLMVIRPVHRASGKTLALTIKNSIISNTSAGAAHGISAFQNTGTFNLSVLNCIIKDCDGVGAFGISQSSGTVTVTHTNNVYWNNTTNAFEAIGATELAVNPLLGNLPNGAIINADSCPHPNGYAVLAPAARRHGSSTFNGLSIDETFYSATGYRYGGTDTVTAGINYYQSAFANRIDSIRPVSGSTKGGTVAIVRGRDFSASGVAALGDSAITQTAWTDSSITGTVKAHAVGRVGVRVTSTTGSSDTLSNGWTWIAPFQRLRFGFGFGF